MEINELAKKITIETYDIDILMDELHSFITKKIKDEDKILIYLNELSKISTEIQINPFYDDERKSILKLIIKIRKFLELGSNISKDWLSINIHPDILSHIESLLETNHYFNAIEESYKLVRKKLKEISWKERATDAFDKKNYSIIFWKEPESDSEKDFFEWIKFLHMAIQFFRNEKSHEIKKDLDYNKTLHYLSLASLALTLIEKK